MNTNKVDWASEVQSAVSAMKEEGAKAYTYMKQEAPEVAAEYLRWQMVKSFTNASIILCISIIGFLLARKLLKLHRKAVSEMETHYLDGWLFGFCAAIVVSFTVLFGSIAVATDGVKAIIAPRIVILEGIKGVLR